MDYLDSLVINGVPYELRDSFIRKLFVTFNPASTKDCAGALQKLIDENPGRTIYVPSGTYQLEKTVKLGANGVTLKSESQAIWSVSSSVAKLDYLFTIDSSIKASGDTSSVAIEGGVFSGVNVEKAVIWIKEVGGQEPVQCNIKGVTIKHVGQQSAETGAYDNAIGLLLGERDNYSNMHLNVEDVQVDGAMRPYEGTPTSYRVPVGVGIRNFNANVNFTNIVINYCKIGVEDTANGSKYTNIHISKLKGQYKDITVDTLDSYYGISINSGMFQNVQIDNHNIGFKMFTNSLSNIHINGYIFKITSTASTDEDCLSRFITDENNIAAIDETIYSQGVAPIVDYHGLKIMYNPNKIKLDDGHNSTIHSHVQRINNYTYGAAAVPYLDFLTNSHCEIDNNYTARAFLPIIDRANQVWSGKTIDVTAGGSNNYNGDKMYLLGYIGIDKNRFRPSCMIFTFFQGLLSSKIKLNCKYDVSTDKFYWDYDIIEQDSYSTSDYITEIPLLTDNGGPCLYIDTTMIQENNETKFFPIYYAADGNAVPHIKINFEYCLNPSNYFYQNKYYGLDQYLRHGDVIDKPEDIETYQKIQLFTKG